MELTEPMMDAFWTGGYIATLFSMGCVAWALVARLVNSSID